MITVTLRESIWWDGTGRQVFEAVSSSQGRWDRWVSFLLADGRTLRTTHSNVVGMVNTAPEEALRCEQS